MQLDHELPPEPERVRVHVWVTGRVQGVGFRAFVEYRARRIGGLTGWVRNVGYDSVEALAEGEQGQVDQFMEMIRQGPSAAHVDGVRMEWEKPTGEFERFEVRRSV